MRTIITACRSCAIPMEVETSTPISKYWQVGELLLLSETVTCEDCGRVHHRGTFMRVKEVKQETEETV